MKKILYIITSIKRSGPNMVLENMIKGINHKQYETYVLSFCEDDEKEKAQLEALGAKCYNCNFKNKLSILFLGVPKVKKILKNMKPDIIHSHGIIPDYINSKIKHNNKITTLHCNINVDYYYAYGKRKSILLTKFHKYCLNKLHNVICCSSSVYNEMKNTKLNNLSYIRNGIGSSQSKKKYNIRKELGIKKNDIVYLYTGALIPRKNIVYLVKTMKDNLKENEHFIILGDGIYFDEIKKYNSHNIHVLGFQKNVDKYLDIANVYVSASKMEGLSISVIEALDRELYLFLSDIESHKEFFSIDKNQYIGEIFNESNFSKQLEKLRKEIVKKQKNTTASQFKSMYLSEKTMMKGYAKFYEKKEN